MLEEVISKKYNLLKPFLDEKSKRLFAAAEALSLGNISLVSRAMDISEETINSVNSTKSKIKYIGFISPKRNISDVEGWDGKNVR